MSTFAGNNLQIGINMKQEYARVSVEMPTDKDKKSLSQELAYEIEQSDINDEFTVKFL